MKKGKKILITFCLGLACIGSIATNKAVNNNSNTTYANHTHSNVIATSVQSTNITITNQKLDTALRNILGISSTDKLKTNSISSHPDFKPTEIPESPGTYTANKICLDLSNTGVTDITELCQFEIPTTLKAINLANNGIKNEDLESIINFTTYAAESNVVYGEKILNVASGIDSNGTRINLCFNEINLNKLQNFQLNHKNIIYGIQNFPKLHLSGLNLKSEVDNCYYYFKDDDFNYLSPSFSKTFNSETPNELGFGHNQILPITKNNINSSDDALGNISISINTGGNTPKYFKDWNFKSEFTVFTANIIEDYTIERMSLFNLPNNKVIINGLINPKWVIMGSPSTKKSGTHPVNIKITTGKTSRLIILNYTVVDTTAPTLELVGQSVMSISFGKEFKDPGCKGYDSNGIEDISENVVNNAHETVDITQKGTYIITYTLSDYAGNKAKPITRTLCIVNRVLDTINIQCNTDTDKLFTKKDITLEVKPDTNTPTENYTNYTYYWYINGILQQETTLGDSVSGKTTRTFTFDSIGDKKISVVLKAKVKATNEIVEVYSDEFTMHIKTETENNQGLIIAAGIAVGIILLAIGIGTFVKYRKAHKKSHSKSKTTAYHKKEKKKKTNTTSDKPEIQVIKDYKGDTNGGNSNQPLAKTKPDNQNEKK